MVPGIVHQLFHLLGIGRIRIGMPRIPIAIRIRQNDADPTRSRSTTVVPSSNAVICGPTWGVMRVGLAGKLRLVAGGAVALISGRGGGAGAALISGRGGGAGPNSGRTGAAPPRLTVATVTLGILNGKKITFAYRCGPAYCSHKSHWES
jgi:hypothetical protein